MDVDRKYMMNLLEMMNRKRMTILWLMVVVEFIVSIGEKSIIK
jgi:hypothetical protein